MVNILGLYNILLWGLIAFFYLLLTLLPMESRSNVVRDRSLQSFTAKVRDVRSNFTVQFYGDDNMYKLQDLNICTETVRSAIQDKELRCRYPIKDRESEVISIQCFVMIEKIEGQYGIALKTRRLNAEFVERHGTKDCD